MRIPFRKMRLEDLEQSIEATITAPHSFRSDN